MATAEIWGCLMENDNDNTVAAAASASTGGFGSTTTTLSSSTVGESNGGAVSLRRRRMEIRRIKMLSSDVEASSSSFVVQPVSKRLRPVTLREDGMEDEKLSMMNRGADNACSDECLGQGSITTTTTASATKPQNRLLLSSVLSKDDDDDNDVVGEKRAASSSLSSACERVPSGGQSVVLSLFSRYTR